MPQYEFYCHACKKKFSKILALADHEEGKVACPHCGSHKIEQAGPPSPLSLRGRAPENWVRLEDTDETPRSRAHSPFDFYPFVGPKREAPDSLGIAFSTAAVVSAAACDSARILPFGAALESATVEICMASSKVGTSLCQWPRTAPYRNVRRRKRNAS
jgi:putative FmdB family regulatory protein